jgi:nitrogen regulatory protein PII-like uncharacterized protein
MMNHIKLFESYTNHINEDILRLRTLTEKSKMGFGRFHDYTVGDILIMGKEDYLQWVYYNSDMISFMPQVLDKLGITGEFIIEKPGKKPDLYNGLKKHNYKNMTDEERKENLKRKSHVNKQNRLNKLNRNISYNSFFKKGVMQSRNQGNL